MSCLHIRELLSDHLDCELSQSASDRVEAHMKLCPSCRDEWTGLRRTVSLVGHLGRERCPVDLREAVVARIRDSRPVPAPRPSLLRRFALGGVAVAVVAGLTPLLLTRGNQEPGGPLPEVAAIDAPVFELHEQQSRLSALGPDGLMGRPARRGDSRAAR